MKAIHKHRVCNINILEVHHKILNDSSPHLLSPPAPAPAPSGLRPLPSRGYLVPVPTGYSMLLHRFDILFDLHSRNSWLKLKDQRLAWRLPWLFSRAKASPHGPLWAAPGGLLPNASRVSIGSYLSVPHVSRPSSSHSAGYPAKRRLRTLFLPLSKPRKGARTVLAALLYVQVIVS